MAPEYAIVLGLGPYCTTPRAVLLAYGVEGPMEISRAESGQTWRHVVLKRPAGVVSVQVRVGTGYWPYALALAWLALEEPPEALTAVVSLLFLDGHVRQDPTPRGVTITAVWAQDLQDYDWPLEARG